MRKNITIILASLSLCQSLMAFSMEDYTSKSGTVSYFTKITDSVTDCIADSLSDGVPEFDICSIEKAISKVSGDLDGKIKNALGINAKFSLGGCSFSAKADPSKCLRGLLKSHCSNSDNPVRKSKIKRGIQNYLTTATSKYAEYGDAEILGKACMTFEEKKKKTPVHTKVYGSTKYENILLTKSGGKYANTRVGKTTLKCIEDAKRNGYDENSCYPEYDGVNADETSTDISEVKVREAIHEQATIVLASPLRDKISDLRNKEADLNSKILTKCGNQSSMESAEKCASTYIKDSYQLDREISDTKVDITKNIAGLSEAIETATTPYNTMNFPTENTANKLPLEKRADYKIKAVRYLAQKSIIQAQIKRVARIERELVEVMYRKAEIASKPFFVKAAASDLGGL